MYMTQAPGIFTITLQRVDTVAEDTVCYIFDKPDNFSFRAGQFATLRLLNVAPAASTHVFSFASAPEDDHIAFAWRAGDSVWKRAASAMRPGAQCQMIAPSGQAVVPPHGSVVFLVAGIGITPVRSIVRSALLRGERRDFTLIYSNRTPASTAFLREWSQYDSVCKTVLTMTDDASWDGVRGVITDAMVRDVVADVRVPHYYIVGTSGFVHAMEMLVAGLGVAPDRIICDNFG